MLLRQHRRHKVVILCFVALLLSCGEKSATTARPGSAPEATGLAIPERLENNASISNSLSQAAEHSTIDRADGSGISGTIVVWDKSARQYRTLDFKSGALGAPIPGNPECNGDLRPRSTMELCSTSGGENYLHDVLRQTTQHLAISNPIWTDWDPTGRYLLFATERENRWSLYSYDVDVGATTILIADISKEDRKNWLNPPKLSPDGSKLIVARDPGFAPHSDVGIYWLQAPGMPLERATPRNQQATQDLAWSPTGGRFAFGATDINQEIGPEANLIFVSEGVSGTTRLLARSAPGEFYAPLSMEFSPNGDMLAIGKTIVGAVREVCIIRLTTVSEICLPALAGAYGQFATWSPAGDRIVFVTPRSTLVALDVARGIQTELAIGIPEAFNLYWR